MSRKPLGAKTKQIMDDVDLGMHTSNLNIILQNFDKRGFISTEDIETFLQVDFSI